MDKFSDLGIKPSIKGLIGDKIKIDRILNREVVVNDYRIKDSKYTDGNGKCLYLQISIGDMNHVVFTGATVLMETIQKVPKEKFPFTTTIIKENEYFEFS
jgi:hypothetical protein